MSHHHAGNPVTGHRVSRVSPILLFGVAGLLWMGCAGPRPAEPTMARPRASSTPIPAPSATDTPRATSTSTVTPYPPPVGPGFVEGFDPLTGLPVRDPGSLLQRPLLVAITNFPPSARPQAGLTAADQVWETSIGQGMTRFLAVYYGDYLTSVAEMQDSGGGPAGEIALGPVRSGRVGFETIRRLYPQAFLLTHSASAQVLEQLTNQVHVPSDDPQDVNSAVLTLDELRAVSAPGADPADYAGLVFDYAPPPGGTPGPTLDVFYNIYNRVYWEYDPAARAYRRWQNTVEDPDGRVPALERLTGEPWGFENVVVLFTGHRFTNPEGTILEIDLLFHPRRFGVLFRDGRMYEVSWSSLGARLEIRTEEGIVVPLRPGRTFFEVVGLESTWDGMARRVRFYSPIPPTPTPTPTVTPTRTPTLTPAATPGP